MQYVFFMRLLNPQMICCIPEELEGLINHCLQILQASVNSNAIPLIMNCEGHLPMKLVGGRLVFKEDYTQSEVRIIITRQLRLRNFIGLIT